MKQSRFILRGYKSHRFWWYDATCIYREKNRPCGNAGAVFYWVLSGVMKRKSPPAPLQKGGRKSTWFFNSKRWNTPTRNPKYAPPFLKGGWGGFSFILKVNDHSPCGNAGAVFYWVLSGVMKRKSPPPPFKKGGEKAPDFLTVNDETCPLEI